MSVSKAPVYQHRQHLPAPLHAAPHLPSHPHHIPWQQQPRPYQAMAYQEQRPDALNPKPDGNIMQTCAVGRMSYTCNDNNFTSSPAHNMQNALAHLHAAPAHPHHSSFGMPMQMPVGQQPTIGAIAQSQQLAYAYRQQSLVQESAAINSNAARIGVNRGLQTMSCSYPQQQSAADWRQPPSNEEQVGVLAAQQFDFSDELATTGKKKRSKAKGGTKVQKNAGIAKNHQSPIYSRSNVPCASSAFPQLMYQQNVPAGHVLSSQQAGAMPITRDEGSPCLPSQNIVQSPVYGTVSSPLNAPSPYQSINPGHPACAHGGTLVLTTQRLMHTSPFAHGIASSQCSWGGVSQHPAGAAELHLASQPHIMLIAKSGGVVAAGSTHSSPTHCFQQSPTPAVAKSPQKRGIRRLPTQKPASQHAFPRACDDPMAAQDILHSSAGTQLTSYSEANQLSQMQASKSSFAMLTPPASNPQSNGSEESAACQQRPVSLHVRPENCAYANWAHAGPFHSPEAALDRWEAGHSVAMMELFTPFDFGLATDHDEFNMESKETQMLVKKLLED